MGEQMSIFDEEMYKKTHEQLTKLVTEIHSYDVQMLGLQMSRDSALGQLYRLIINIPMENRKAFTRRCIEDEQNIMIEAIAKNAARAYIYGARPKGGDADAQSSLR